MVSGDLFLHDGTNYLLVVASYSKWPCTAPLRRTSSASIIAAVERIFSDFRMPEVFESENGTQLLRAEIVAFYTQRCVQFVTFSPEYPQSKGLVEWHIQTVKRTILKTFGEGKFLWQALAAIRSTPVLADMPSPSVLHQDRHIRGTLHFIPAQLQSQFAPSDLVRCCLQRRQATAHFHHGGVPDVRGSALIVVSAYGRAYRTSGRQASSFRSAPSQTPTLSASPMVGCFGAHGPLLTLAITCRPVFSLLNCPSPVDPPQLLFYFDPTTYAADAPTTGSRSACSCFAARPAAGPAFTPGWQHAFGRGVLEALILFCSLSHSLSFSCHFSYYSHTDFDTDSPDYLFHFLSHVNVLFSSLSHVAFWS